MYIFGGRGDLNGPYHSQEEVYCSDIMYLDTRTGRWHRPITSGDAPVGRRSHSACKEASKHICYQYSHKVCVLQFLLPLQTTLPAFMHLIYLYFFLGHYPFFRFIMKKS